MRNIMKWSILVILMLYPLSQALAEYRAYELEVYDQMSRKSEIVITSFSPSDYILTQGGSNRVSVIIRATWMCWGNTSNFQKVCQPPAPINPRFQVGDRVQVILKKHVTDQWEGIVEKVSYRRDLRSNVYGIRFSEQRNLYANYYEANLQIVSKTP